MDGIPVRLVTTDASVIGRALPPGDTAVFRTGRPHYRRERDGARDLTAYTAPLGPEGSGRAVLALRIDFAPRQEVVAARTRGLALAAGGAGALVVALVLFVLGRLLLRPLGRLTEATRQVASGDLGARLGWTRADEVGEVGRAFDRMIGAVQGARARLVDGSTELRRARSAQERLRRVAEAIAGGDDLPAVLGRAAAEAGALLGSDAAAVTRFDGDRLVVVAPWSAVTTGRVRMDRAGATATVRDTGRAARDVRVIPAPDGDRARVSVAAPVIVGGAVWGAVGAATRAPAACRRRRGAPGALRRAGRARHRATPRSATELAARRPPTR